MSSNLSRVGRASCQLCTAQFTELKDLDFIRASYQINRTISAAKLIFDSVDKEKFLFDLIRPNANTEIRSNPCTPNLVWYYWDFSYVL